MSKELTVGDLIKELKEYPDDTPLWPQLNLPFGMVILDLECSRYGSLDGGNSFQLHLIFKKSEIYDLKKEDFMNE